MGSSLLWTHFNSLRTSQSHTKEAPSKYLHRQGHCVSPDVISHIKTSQAGTTEYCIISSQSLPIYIKSLDVVALVIFWQGNFDRNFNHSPEEVPFVTLQVSDYNCCISSSKKAWTQALHRYKSYSQHLWDLQ